MTADQCNAGSPNVRVGDLDPASYTCQLAADHDGYHTSGPVTWRDPEPILDEPKPWHPDHRPHLQV
jgi:hypothetical protein